MYYIKMISRELDCPISFAEMLYAKMAHLDFSEASREAIIDEALFQISMLDEAF